jgi:two-component system, response regulator PdtaR
MNILIVEDEVLSAMYIEYSLAKNKDFLIDSVSDGEIAVKYAIEQKPDVILMDIKLGGSMSGIEASEKINLVYQPRIIFMTGFQGEELEEQTRHIPNSFVIEKPIRIEDILKYISIPSN